MYPDNTHQKYFSLTSHQKHRSARIDSNISTLETMSYIEPESPVPTRRSISDSLEILQNSNSNWIPGSGGADDYQSTILDDDTFRLLLNPNVDHSDAIQTSMTTAQHIRKISRNDNLSDGEQGGQGSKDATNVLAGRYSPVQVPKKKTQSKTTKRNSPVTRKYNRDKLSASLSIFPVETFEDEDQSNTTATQKAEEENAPVVPLTDIDDEDVNDDDVLCGRGGGTNSQVGNRRFRSVVQSYQPTYLKARRKEKPLMAREIVQVIRKKGGRFLKRDKKTLKWNDIGDEKAEAKTGQALREGLDVRATTAAISNVTTKRGTGQSKSQTYSLSPNRRTVMVSGLNETKLSPIIFSPKVGPSLPRIKRTRFVNDEKLKGSRCDFDGDDWAFTPPEASIKKVKYTYDHVVTSVKPRELPFIDSFMEAPCENNNDIFRPSQLKQKTELTPGQFEFWDNSWSCDEDDDNEKEIKEWAV